MKKYLVVCLLALACACAQAGVGLAELPGLKGDGPVTVYYPSAGADRPLQRGPFALNLDWQGQPVRGNGRLVVISHGSGGAPWVHADLARALVDAGFVVALPEHRGDNYKDPSAPRPRKLEAAAGRSLARHRRGGARTRASRRCCRSTRSACTACPPAATPRWCWPAAAGRRRCSPGIAKPTSRRTSRPAWAWSRD